MSTRMEWKPLRDGKYATPEGYYFKIEGNMLTIGAPHAELIGFHLPKTIRIAQLEEVRDEPGTKLP